VPLFNRLITIEVGVRGQESALEISQLRISFKINKTLEHSSNSATISIYNLSENTRTLLKEVFNSIIIKAGYADGAGTKLAFIGDITESTTKRQGANLVTTISAGDSLKVLQNTKFNQSYSEGVSGYQILNDIVDALGLPVKLTDRLKKVIQKKGKKFANGYSANGNAKEQLTKLAKQLNLEWSFQNGTIKLLEKEETDDSPIIVLARSTGLIGLPERITDLKLKSETDKKVKKGSKEKDIKRKGWKLTSLLMADIEPGGQVLVDAQELGVESGIYRTEEVEHSGDNFGTNFNTITKVADIA